MLHCNALVHGHWSGFSSWLGTGEDNGKREGIQEVASSLDFLFQHCPSPSSLWDSCRHKIPGDLLKAAQIQSHKTQIKEKSCSTLSPPWSPSLVALLAFSLAFLSSQWMILYCIVWYLLVLHCIAFYCMVFHCIACQARTRWSFFTV